MSSYDDVAWMVQAFVEGWFIARGKGCSTLQQEGTAWHIHYGVPMGGRDHELFVWQMAPERVRSVAHRLTRGAPHWLGVLQADGAELETGYAAANYIPSVYEMIMHRPPAPITMTPLPEGFLLQQVITSAQADWYNRLQKRQAIYPAELTDNRLRYYLVYQGMLPVARGRLALLDGGIFTLDGIHTLHTHRRRGVGRAMVTRMIHDAAAAGHPTGILSSSDMGHPLYRQLGYEDILPLTIFDSVATTAII